MCIGDRFTNAGDGIPAYIRIDMATQDTELVRLDEGMKYTPCLLYTSRCV